MMHEILFRGQHRRYGEKVNLAGEKLPAIWVYGGVLQGKGAHSIIYGSESPDGDFAGKYPVYTDTLGQFTGKTDKNGKKIFEGDILGKHGFWSLVVEFQRIMPLHPVQYNNSKGIPIYSFDSTSWEVIGNIYDNFCPNCGAGMRRESEVKE